jgi:hypothetical protein
MANSGTTGTSAYLFQIDSYVSAVFGRAIGFPSRGVGPDAIPFERIPGC